MSESIEVSDYDLEATSNSSDDTEVVVKNKVHPANPSENYGATPLEDRYGNHLWVRTRMCFCLRTDETDCRFHSQKEKGWEQCPRLPEAKKDPKMKGLWLWARNHEYGKAPVTEAA